MNEDPRAGKLTRDERDTATAITAKYSGSCPVCHKMIMKGEPCLVFDRQIFDQSPCLDQYAGFAVPVKAKKSTQTVVPGAYQAIEAEIRECRDRIEMMHNDWCALQALLKAIRESKP